MKKVENRYDTIGSTTLFFLENSGGVYEAINIKLPNFLNKTFLKSRNDLKLQVMTRQRYRWDLACEKSDVKSRHTFAAALHSIRVYFYSLEQWNNFATDAGNHKHSSDEAENKYHDDYEDGTFHLHLKHPPTEFILPTI